MKKLIWILFALMLLSACGQNKEIEQEAGIVSITAQQAKEIMNTQEGYIILDVRTSEEYSTGHIPGAVLLPHEDVNDKAQAVLPNKDQLILVYCRSGNRSKQASKALAELGYTNIKEFGGINDWPYEVE